MTGKKKPKQEPKKRAKKEVPFKPIDQKKLVHKTRIAVNLTNLSFEVESSTASLEEVFAVSDLIARHLGTERGLDGKSWDERIKGAGIV